MNTFRQPEPPLKRQPPLSLITPSASPPGSRYLSRPPNYPPEQPSPPKRPRLASTPSSSTSSFLTPAHKDLDLAQARFANTMRLRDAWAQLANRYNRPLDEDDIIDLASLDLIKDRGVVRSSTAETRYGFMVAPDEASSEAGGAQTEGEDETDEIDAFAPGAEIEEALDVGEKLRKVLPPLGRGEGPMHPEDEDDLKEFLSAEKRRQEIYGNPDEDYEGVDLSQLLAEGEGGDEGESADEEGEVEEEVEVLESSGTDESSDDEGESARPLAGKRGSRVVTGNKGAQPPASPTTHALDGVSPDPPTQPSSSAKNRQPSTKSSTYALSLAADESEDELGGWELDEASYLYEITRAPAAAPSQSSSQAAPRYPSASDHEIEVIEIFDTPPPSPPPKKTHISQAQLQTPPRSFSSTGEDGPSAPSTRPRARPAYKKAAKTPITLVGSSSAIPASSPPHSAASSPPLSAAPSSPVVPHLNLSQISKRPKTPKTVLKKLLSTKPPKSKTQRSMVPEVVIQRRPTVHDKKNAVGEKMRKGSDSEKRGVSSAPPPPVGAAKSVSRNSLVTSNKGKSGPKPAVALQEPASREYTAPAKRPVGRLRSVVRDPVASPDKKAKGKGRASAPAPAPMLVHDSRAKGPVHALDTKGKGRATDFFDCEPDRISSVEPRSSPTSMVKQRSISKRPTLIPSAPKKSSVAPMESSPSRKPMSTARKRKRVSSLPDSPSPPPQPIAGPSRLAYRTPSSPGQDGGSQPRDAERELAPMPQDDLLRRGRSLSRDPRSRSRASSMPGSEHYPYPDQYDPYHPPWMGRNTPAPYPAPVQAQYLLAQAMQHLSYLIGAGVGAPPAGEHNMPWPPAPPRYPPYWPPYTPTHHPCERSDSAGPRSALRTPASSERPYTPSSAYPYTPSSSSYAPLPPSSPGPDDMSSPAPGRSQSRARSRSKGRRVSFRLEGGQVVEAESSDWDGEAPSSPSLRARGRDVEEEGGNYVSGKKAMTGAVKRGERGRTPGPGG